MRVVRWIIPWIFGFFLLPTSVLACVYPGSLRSVNATLLTVLDGGGDVSVHHRDVLRRSLSRMDAAGLLRTLDQDVARRDARAARAVLTTAQALAQGRGVRVEAGLRSDVDRLSSAADAACSDAVNAASGAENASGAEQGTGRQTGQGGRPLTFREGVVRLSLTFTIYLIFLAFLLGLRRQLNERRAQQEQEDEAEPLSTLDRSTT